ncbi:DMT family transporter, partial [Candidatus Bathyarchaeota archaeon]|nr:DMT family transporter [Candidatus Bathyarchaeota archaeon]
METVSDFGFVPEFLAATSLLEPAEEQNGIRTVFYHFGNTHARQTSPMHILSAGISNDCARINSYTSSADQYFAMNMKHAGVLAVLAASLAWALEPIFAKLSYNTSDFLHTLMFRAVLAALIALVYGTLTSKANFKIDKLQLSALVYVALAANLFGDIMYFYALTLVPVLNAVLIGYMQPIFIV